MKATLAAANRIPRLWMSLLFLATAELHAEQSGLFTYRVDGDELTITDYPEDATGEVVIPAEIEGAPVTRIGYAAFRGCTGLTSIPIPSRVTRIGPLAFRGCTGLQSINVSLKNENFVSIDGVLLNADRTVLLRCPEGRTGSDVIPESVTTIGVYSSSHHGGGGVGAFLNCSKLTSVTIPSSVTGIVSEALRDCAALLLRKSLFQPCFSSLFWAGEGGGACGISHAGDAAW